MISQSQNLKLSQKLFPKVILNQSVLAVPTLALEQMIKKELEENVLLEEEASDELKEEPAEDSLDNREEEAKKEDEEPSENTKEDELDWDDYFNKEEMDYDPAEHTPKGTQNDYDNSNIQAASFLNESLMLQLHLMGLPAKKTFIGEEIIGSLNDEGYLTTDIIDLIRDIDELKVDTEFKDEFFSIMEVEDVLKELQGSLEPAGIGARNLQECLSIQIQRSAIDSFIKKNALRVVNEFFEELRLKNYEKLAKELNTSLEKVKKIFELIHKLNPKPGQTESGTAESYIYPDIIITKVNNNYEVYLNEKNVPSLRINKSYREMYQSGDKIDKDTKEFLSNNFNRAKWFLDAINSRRQTLLKVMNSILQRQYVFFNSEGTGLRPMIEKDVAEDIGMDVSTVSRAVKGKYVQTDFGIYSLKSFFSNALTNEDGFDVSAKEAKDKLKQIIENEDKKNPFTDDALVKEMTNAGYKIARRTVTKYREAMNIPKARLRRSI